MEELNQNQEEPKSVIKSILVEQEEKARESVDPLVVVIGAVNALKDREREVLLSRFGLEDGNKMTLEAVGAKFGVTRERVRQIENSSIKKLGTKPSRDLARLQKIIDGYLMESGGLVSLDGLAEYFKLSKDQRREAELNALRLVMAMDANVKTLSKASQLKTGWLVKNLSEAMIVDALAEIKKILGAKKSAMTIEELWSQFSSSEIYQHNSSKFTPSVLNGVLRVGNDLALTPEGKWGLTSWPTVVPKRIRDKVYLILQKTAKPMHFREITDAINQVYTSKPVLSRTVHNELIGDGRFVLVGRGIYGLKEWGYQPGVVSDVIMKVMRVANQPMSVDEVIEAVLKDRQVKRNTVVANLQNKKLFRKVGKGMYALNEEAK